MPRLSTGSAARRERGEKFTILSATHASLL